MKFQLFRLILIISLLLVASFAQAASNGSATLEHFYNKVQSLTADFKQVQRDDENKVVQKASGIFLLSRPEKFRWEYKKPYEQVIVSDGENFKFYDKDLAQVTVRKVEATLQATPALLLTGGEALKDAFQVEDKGQNDGMSWVHLTPRKDDTDFNSIELGLKDDVPKLMRLHDKMGQTTSIEFRNVKINPSLGNSHFKLNTPDNVEVVDGRKQAAGQGGQN